MARRSSRRISRRQREQNEGIAALILVTGGLLAGTSGALLTKHPWLGPVLVMFGVVVVVGAVVLTFFVVKARRAAAERRRLDQLGFLSEIGGLLTLSPREFEQVVRDLMTYWGYSNVRHTGGSGDLGADVTATTTSGETIIVQCKQYRLPNKVRSGEMQQFIGMLHVHHRTNLGLYVTTSEFTKNARGLGVQHGIRLINGQELVGHIRQWRASLATVTPRA